MTCQLIPGHGDVNAEKGAERMHLRLRAGQWVEYGRERAKGTVTFLSIHLLPMSDSCSLLQNA